MSTLDLENKAALPERAPIKVEVKQELGASACDGCPLIQLGCPGKVEATTSCPPAAEKIQQADVKKALQNDQVKAIFTDDAGYYAVTEKSVVIQPSKMVLSKEVPKTPAAPARASKPRRPERRFKPHDSGVLQVLGELVAAIVLPGLKAK